MKEKTKEDFYVENLKDIKKIFEKNNILFWLDWGTLLGAVRDKKMIPWDFEIDLGVMNSEYKKIVSAYPEFEEKGFRINETTIPIINSDFIHKKVSFTRFKCAIDIWQYSLKNNQFFITFFSYWTFKNRFTKPISIFLWILWRLLLVDEINTKNKLKAIIISILRYSLFLLPVMFRKILIKKIKKILGRITIASKVPKNYFERFKKINYYNIIFNIPVNTDNYLEYKYGKNWRIPDKKWDWRNDELSIRK